MSSRAARGFLPVLRELDRELPVPLPDRVRILRELEYDLEQLRDGLVARGVNPDEARRRALEALLPDRLSRHELGRVHAPLYRRLTQSIDEHRLRLVERSALALATATVLLAETLVLLRVDLLNDPSPFLWPVIGLGACLFAVCVAEVFALWIKRDHRRPERRLGAILGVSGAILAAGIVGSIVDFYRLAGILEGAPGLEGALASRWLVRDAALLSVSILLSLAGGLVWFVLVQWVALVSGARREVLGLGREDSSHEETPS